MPSKVGARLKDLLPLLRERPSNAYRWHVAQSVQACVYAYTCAFVRVWESLRSTGLGFRI